ncbi:oxygenase MpaB family protein [Roseivirga thermotolerans]|uniref:ER-bound oxygenase mpaB/mpaB'/Rubber oxygenase catalytic domain-containing protein n=1 Tax=Roseivirga thermotolerans TaxID=1758176 RepID=A0ABQ3I7M1_9BACT|nr:oxygenase MpaB family protein [Roseivirga thermotolerans]GHE71352.1 hypothetical protein GCM10011340_29130 [Roseivirga thermotolerans]
MTQSTAQLTSEPDAVQEFFVPEGSIVRQIWADGDTILLIFAGAAAEFALSKAVDWLYFTGRLPSDPLGRLLSTVTYAKRIVFSQKQDAFKAIDSISAIHHGVEYKRGFQIPEWAYRDVLFMLIDYSIRAYEVLHRQLTNEEKEEVFRVFNQLGEKMEMTGLPETYQVWMNMRQKHLKRNLEFSDYTSDLFLQYKLHLGSFRYHMLLQVQAVLAPKKVRSLMGLKKKRPILLLIGFYRIIRPLGLNSFLKRLVLPGQYRQQFMQLGGTA